MERKPGTTEDAEEHRGKTFFCHRFATDERRF
jgi:hypothetical protein